MDKQMQTAIHVCTPETVAAFLQHEQATGASEDCLRQRKNHVNALYQWLPPEKEVTYEALRLWRKSLQSKGYASATVGNYIKNINRYLDFAGQSHLRFQRGRAKNLQGKQFGYLTAIEPAGMKYRKDILWNCRCRCGREVVLPATRLLTGNTASCGCLVTEHLGRVNQYIDNTSLRSALRDQVRSAHAASGYTGVMAKNGKWVAYINYKRKRYFLGSYAKLEDAVKARANAKEMVLRDAQKLMQKYEQIHQADLNCLVGEDSICK